MRGYAYLKKTNRLGLIRRIKNNLVDCQFESIGKKASFSVFGASIDHAELLTRQFLLQRNAYSSLPKAILYSLGKTVPIVHPMPKRWQELLREEGLSVNRAVSTLAWMVYILLYWGYGVLLTVQFAAASLWTTIHRTHRPIQRYAYFDGLSAGNLPQPASDGRSYDIFTWYSNWKDQAERLVSLCHGISGTNNTTTNGFAVEYIGKPFQPLNGFINIARFLVWAFRTIISSGLDAMRGRWWHALLLAEAAKAKMVQLNGQRYLAADYLFHYSSTIYRPMWTYEAECRGSRIISYFYSASEQVKLPEGYESLRYEWGAASWPNYLVWDEYQEKSIRPEIGNHATIKVVGPIWFVTSSKEPPVVPKRSIAVFDIQPHRKSAHFGFTTLSDYVARYPNVQYQFLEDIHTVLSECNVIMVFKKKREIGNKGTKKYKKLGQNLSRSDAVIVIDPNISALRVIEKCGAVISMPFTSTALYLRDKGIDSVYYDPTGWIQKDDRGAHGIPILSGREELGKWVKSIFHIYPENNERPAVINRKPVLNRMSNCSGN